QECRLAQRNPESAPWHPHDCAKCPIPDIVRANASPNMRLRLTIKPGILGIGRSLRVDAYCEKHAIPIDDPFVGCPQCNAERPGIDAFLDALETRE
ncbi:MAG: hypothetical protein IT324_24800, partial [Anaerolineae bacterium]|nr:hypothetical protein [Anaerolineae bacterium]